MATENKAIVNCPKCGNAAKRFGHHRNGLQRFRCNTVWCRATFSEDHTPAFRVEDYMHSPKGLLAIQLLLEGCSVRSAERITGIRPASICKLLLIAGYHCERLMLDKIKNVHVEDLEADEIWGFVGKKERNKRDDETMHSGIGDAWCFVAQERHTKLILAWQLGKRTQETAQDLMYKVRAAASEDSFQLTTDGFKAYPDAVQAGLGGRVSFAQLIKVYRSPRESEARYSPSEIVSTEVVPVMGSPDPKRICTSHIERQNLDIRMGMRRMTRLTNAFSKSWDHLRAAYALWFAYFNFCRIHGSLRVTPAMESGLTDHVWKLTELFS